MTHDDIGTYAERMLTDTRTWNVAGIHGQPPPNTLIDVAPVGLTVSVMQTAAVPDLRPATKWRLSDLPPLDAVQPAPAPERPEPKFAPGASVLVNDCGRYTVDGPPEWDDGQWYYDLDGGEGGCPLPVGESALTAAPEPSIPIGGWFDPGDGRTLQRKEAPDWVTHHAEDVWFNSKRFGLVWTKASDCSPLTEREAMERLYPVGTWLRDRNHDDSFVVREWWDGAAGPIAGVSFDDRRTGSMDGIYIHEHCTVLPDPPLTAPWRHLDELPEDGVQVLALRTSGGYSLEWAEHVRISSSFAVWADLDDVAPIPAHLRSTP